MILLVAADPMEFSGMVSLASDHGPVPMGVDWARCARLGPYDALLVANGVGKQRAAAALDASIGFGLQAVISTGFCGALDEGLNIADLIVATAIDDGVRQFPALPVAGAIEAYTGVVKSRDAVARTAEEKQSLHTPGSLAVEMEAAGVAQRSAELQLPFYCVRSVTDLASETMANDFNRALRPDGHFDTINILLGALRDPAVRLPELLRLRSRSVQAARKLGEFFADCRL